MLSDYNVDQRVSTMEIVLNICVYLHIEIRNRFMLTPDLNRASEYFANLQVYYQQ